MSKRLLPVIGKLRRNKLAEATRLIHQTLQNKMAARLAEERKDVAARLVIEDSDPFKYECLDCDKQFTSQSMDAKCPKCKSDNVTDRGNVKSIKSADNIKEASTTPPADWKSGFTHPYRIGGGGSETPFIKNGKWYIYVWNTKTGGHEYYSYSDDIFMKALDEEASDEPKTKVTKDGITLYRTQRPDGTTIYVSVPPSNNEAVNEDMMPVSDVQRIYDETGSVAETELLCGIARLTINRQKQVVSYISEAALKSSRSETCPACQGNGWRNGVTQSSICERCAGAGTVLMFEDADKDAQLDRLGKWIDGLETKLKAAKEKKDWKEVARLQDHIADAEDDAKRLMNENDITDWAADDDEYEKDMHPKNCGLHRGGKKCTCGAQARFDKEAKSKQKQRLKEDFSYITQNGAITGKAVKRATGAMVDFTIRNGQTGESRTVAVTPDRANKLWQDIAAANLRGKPATTRVSGISEDSKIPLAAHSPYCDVHREDEEDWSKPVKCTCGAEKRLSEK